MRTSKLAAIRLVSALPLALLLARPAHAQEPHPIQDNSFLIEEAYNQEPGVVQHVSTFEIPRDDQWTLAFAQEWPAFGLAHQLSFAIPVQRIDQGPGSVHGIGDISIDYRYQAIGDADATVAAAARVSVLLPTGSEERGLGAGDIGFDGNLPVSVVLSPAWVTHGNVGATYYPSVDAPGGGETGTLDYRVGESLIWLAHPSFNLMLEFLWESEESVGITGETERENGAWLSPGARFAITLDNGLQIVPGVGVPIGLGAHDGERALFFYLSLEHPFRGQE